MNIFEKTYYSIISESANTIEQISKNKLENLITSNTLRNKNKNFKFKNIIKFFNANNPQISFYVLKYNGIIKGIAITTIDNNICFINELASLESGFDYGSELLNYFLDKPFRLIYLFADWSQPNNLLNYYRNPKFCLKEFINKISGVHWFYKNRTMEFNKLNKFISKKFI